MACPACQRRATLIAALAPTISNLPLDRESLLGLLSLPNAQLLHATKTENPHKLSPRLELPLPTDTVPTALCHHDPLYPTALAQLPSAPAVLYATCTHTRLGELLSKPTVAITGGCVHTSYAQQMTFALANDLASAGITLICGVYNGLEAVAHQGALHAGGNTIAVLPDGANQPYPNDQNHLHQSILQRGAALSELPPGFSPQQLWCLIARVRITAALASVVVVVEAGTRSHGLFTAQIAAELGHEVAVLPGRVTDPGSHDTIGLLRDGAHPIACASDVLELIHEKNAPTPIGIPIGIPPGAPAQDPLPAGVL